MALFRGKQLAGVPIGAPGAYISAGLQKARILLENLGQADGRACRNLAAGQAGAEVVMGYNCA